MNLLVSFGIILNSIAIRLLWLYSPLHKTGSALASLTKVYLSLPFIVMTSYRLYIASLLHSAVPLSRSQQTRSSFITNGNGKAWLHLGPSTALQHDRTITLGYLVSAEPSVSKLRRPAQLKKYVCHCKECQKQSASAFGTSAIFPSERMWPLPRHLQGHLNVWKRLADSDNTVECYFCTVCGVRILGMLVYCGEEGTLRSCEDRYLGATLGDELSFII